MRWRAVALADKLDTWCASGAIGEKPNRQRRSLSAAARGACVIRIVLENDLRLSLTPHLSGGKLIEASTSKSRSQETKGRR